jgi:chromosome segregation ATPase
VLAPLAENLSATPRTLIGASVVLLGIAAIFGALNVKKVKTLRSSAADATAARESADRGRAQHENELKAGELALASAQAKLAERAGKVDVADSQVARIATEKTQLEAKLHDKESEILALQKQLAEKQPGSVNPGAASPTELQAQLDDARQQLDVAEREKRLLSEKVQAVTERSSQAEDEKSARLSPIERLASKAKCWPSIRLTTS